MKALQYIYTSWKNGNSTEKGYMIYSRSLGISDEDCTVIKDAMQYMAPKELNLAPTQQEIDTMFPYSFAYFSLPSGKKCISQSTYLGKDYSGRYGNYIIYAMIFDTEDISCRPSELFGEEYIKTRMTAEELNASSPIPPLPELNITSYGTVINDEQLNEFLFERENEFAQLISSVLTAIDNKIPFFLNDTRENLILWSSAMQRIFPLNMALKFTFNTYIGNHEFLYSKKARDEGLNFCLVGVRPDANYFNYSSECCSNRHVVLDFVNGYMTSDILVENYAEAMALSMATDFDEIDSFGKFLDETSFSDVNGTLKIAYNYYRLLKHGEFSYSDKLLQDVINFGEKYCSEKFNSELGSKLLSLNQEDEWSIKIESIEVLWAFCCKYSGFMIYTLFELLQNALYNLSSASSDNCDDLLRLTDNLYKNTPQEYKNFLDYENSAQEVDQLLLYLYGHDNINTNYFYIKWILGNYQFSSGLNNRQPIGKLLNTLMSNISKLNNIEVIMQILLNTSSNRHLFKDIANIFIKVGDNRRLDRLCDVYYKFMNNLDDKIVKQFEQLLLETPNVAQLALLISTKKIEYSDKPADEFWDFYNINKYSISRIENFSIQPLLLACLNRLSGEKKEKFVVQIIYEVDKQFLENEATKKILAKTLESFNVKFLSNINKIYLGKFYQNYIKDDLIVLPKLQSIVIGNYFSDLSSEQQSSIILSEVLNKYDIELSFFEKNDYMVYLEKYIEAYFKLVRSEKDVNVLIMTFYHKKKFDEFVKYYIKYIKSIKNHKEDRWKVLILWTIMYILSDSQSNSEAVTELKSSMVRYLRGIDPDDLLDIKHLIMTKNISKFSIDSFFENVKRKEGIYERITNIFLKNN